MTVAATQAWVQQLTTVQPVRGQPMVRVVIDRVGNRSAARPEPYLGLRFSYFREWLRAHGEVQLAVLVDAFDTQIVNDPFDAMRMSQEAVLETTDLPPLFVQREWRDLRQSFYMLRRIKACLTPSEQAALNLSRPILNCGVVGGGRVTLLRLLDPWTARMASLPRDSHCLHVGPDMTFFNQLLHGATLALAVRDGPPFTHVFRNVQSVYHVQEHSEGGRIGAAAACAYPQMLLLPHAWSAQQADHHVAHALKWHDEDEHVLCTALPFAVTHKLSIEIRRKPTTQRYGGQSDLDAAAQDCAPTGSTRAQLLQAAMWVQQRDRVVPVCAPAYNASTVVRRARA